MSARIAIVGSGVVGRRVAKRLSSRSGRNVVDLDARIVDFTTSRRIDDVDVVVMAQPGPHHRAAMEVLARGVSVVSIADQVDDVAQLLAGGDQADAHDATLVVGAGMSPGLVALLARLLAAQFATVDEIHVAIHGTAGPACARQHHRALAGAAVAFDDGAFTTTRAGIGRELCWFPEPVGAYDCYRAELPGPLVLHEVFPEARRITARMSANRRDRLTSRLPMLTPPHAEGGVGAIRVELRGSDSTGARLTSIAGIAEMVGTAAAATAAAYVEAIVDGRVGPGLVVPGAPDVDTLGLLHDIERFGVRLQEFTGVPSA